MSPPSSLLRVELTSSHPQNAARTYFAYGDPELPIVANGDYAAVYQLRSANPLIAGRFLVQKPHPRSFKHACSKTSLKALSIRHAHIAHESVDYVSNSEGLFFVFEEWPSQCTLANYVEANGPLDCATTLVLMSQILAGAGYYQDKFLTHHGGIMPATIFFRIPPGQPRSEAPYGHVKLGFDANTLTTMLGTDAVKPLIPPVGIYAAFCPPEFTADGIFNEKSDVWCCGCTFVFMLQGVGFYQGNSLHVENPESPDSLRRKLEEMAVGLSWKSLAGQESIKLFSKYVFVAPESRRPIHRLRQNFTQDLKSLIKADLTGEVLHSLASEDVSLDDLEEDELGEEDVEL
ncbi:hypothetical protein C8J56DRAFT_1167023 [Mycena floridula]|nr:hypothetical protein C8J56DRAFT_1167023 [Mycena floridula]